MSGIRTTLIVFTVLVPFVFWLTSRFEYTPVDRWALRVTFLGMWFWCVVNAFDSDPNPWLTLPILCLVIVNMAMFAVRSILQIRHDRRKLAEIRRSHESSEPTGHTGDER